MIPRYHSRRDDRGSTHTGGEKVMTLPAPEIPNAREQAIPAAENLFKALLVMALLLGSFYAAGRIATAIESANALPPAGAFAFTWAAVGLLAIVNGVLAIAWIALAHDAVHRVL